MLQDGGCIFPALYDNNCARYESAYCNRCRDGYYLLNYQCAAVDGNCVQFDAVMNVCVECANGMYADRDRCI